MFLKIEYEGKEKFVEFRSEKFTIGRGSQADVVIRAEGVSRTHLEMVAREDGYFVQDLGSTNGTFINDIRLEPNKLTEFHSFFPISMGGQVSISLVEKREDNNFETDPNFNPSSLTSEKTGEFYLDRDPSLRRSRKRDWSWVKGLGPSFLMLFGFIALSVFYVWWKGEEEAIVQNNATVNKPAPKVAKKEVVSNLVNRRNFLSVLPTINLTEKCQEKWVEKLCRDFSGLRLVDANEGLIAHKDSLVVMIDYSKSISAMKKHYGLNLQDKNELVNRFENVYPNGDLEDFQIKYQYQVYQYNETLNKRAAILFDFIRLKEISSVIKNSNIKSIIFVQRAKNLIEGYKDVQKFFYLYLEVGDVLKLVDNKDMSIKALRFAILANDPVYLERLMPALVTGIDNIKTPLFSNKKSKGL